MKSRDGKSQKRKSEEKVREEKTRKKKINGEKIRESQKKKTQVLLKGRKVARHCVFPMICGSGGRKVGLLERRVRSHLAR